MKQTLLELTQSILASMDSDEVNSISDTTESYDIALLLRDTYYDIANDLGLVSHESLFELEASGDALQPTLMLLPENVQTLYWIKYNNQLSTETTSNYIDVTFKKFDDFMVMQRGYRLNTSDVGQMSFDMNENNETFEVMYRSNLMPNFWTDIGNNLILFDSYDSSIDTTLMKSKTMCGGILFPTFELDDSFIPNLDASDFPYYRNKAKYRAFLEKKQVENKEAQTEARNQKILIQKRKNKVNEGTALERMSLGRYGRKSTTFSIFKGK